MPEQDRDTVLLLRAFGDFIIALNALVSSNRKDTLNIVASRHLEPLYAAIPPAYRPADISLAFQDFGIRKNMLRCFSNRYLISLDTLNELAALRSYIKQKTGAGRWLLEQKRRSGIVSFFTGTKFGHIAGQENIYKAYDAFFESNMSATRFEPTPQPGKVLVIRDARIRSRNIPPGIIEKISKQYELRGTQVTVGFFRSAPQGIDGVVCYQDFEELVALVMAADLVITPDSMPAHLCQLLSKPHYILHPAAVEDQFFTPFALQHQLCFSFEEIEACLTFPPLKDLL
jgi:hypothetical protein